MSLFYANQSPSSEYRLINVCLSAAQVQEVEDIPENIESSFDQGRDEQAYDDDRRDDYDDRY